MPKKINKSKEREIIENQQVEISIDMTSTLDKLSRNRKTKRGAIDNATIIAVSNAVPMQGVPFPYTIEWNEQIELFERAMNSETPVYIVPTRTQMTRPELNNLSPIGVEMRVMKIIDLPDGHKNTFLIGGDRVKIHADAKKGEVLFHGEIEISKDRLLKSQERQFHLTMELVMECYEFIRNFVSEFAKVQMNAPRELREDLKQYLNFIIVTSPIDYQERVKMLEEANLLSRAEMALISLDHIKRQIDLRNEIFSKASAEIEKEQRDHFLRTQIRHIQNEIGEGENGDIELLERRAAEKQWSTDMQQTFEKEINKLRRLSPMSPDYSVQYNYLDNILNLPWNKLREGAIKIDKLEKDLDKDHYGLEKIKERIIEHVAVLKLRGDMKSPILCLYGPPGVGKTSLCKSIADSLGRDYARISLGGLHDETQLRGHRRTYVGALPGRIISALQKGDSNNPIFVLDEIDKIGNDMRGDPAQALLEILDPEQNSKFHDNYIDLDYDLSKVFFIATANSLNGISAPLLDRMELIEVSGYLPEEKIEIAKRHLIPRLLENHGFEKGEIKFTKEALEKIISEYTRESGVRKLEKSISGILRKIAVNKAKGKPYMKKIQADKVAELLGKAEVISNYFGSKLPVGVAVGLAWTQVGGEILYFESSLSKGKGQLSLTGNLGDVMKESATIAWKWIKSNSEFLGIDSEKLDTTDVHLHVPEGAVPKDGPSAGITMITSMVSGFTDKPVKEGIAMTGEATLSGRVLPVGGIKEKVLAAKRAGIKDIIISTKNRKDIEEIDGKYLEGVTFHYVEKVEEVVKQVFG